MFKWIQKSVAHAADLTWHFGFHVRHWFEVRFTNHYK